jgi:hypothetical protein
MPKKILAWHFVGSKLRDGRKIPKDGEKLTCNDELKLCVSGLHASIRVLDALRYAPGVICCRVEISGKIIKGTDKLVCSERTILWRVNAKETLLKFSRECALDVVHLWDAPDAVVKFLKTGDLKLANVANDAAYAAANAAYAANAAAYAYATSDAAYAAANAAYAANATASAANAAAANAAAFAANAANAANAYAYANAAYAANATASAANAAAANAAAFAANAANAANAYAYAANATNAYANAANAANAYAYAANATNAYANAYANAKGKNYSRKLEEMITELHNENTQI